ncbi:MerR family transcriptional regulator [Novosphingobium aerophilum]|uniref:MerR family transcriptional regulator n=1 Tax=Novosphingobium TaxID=165696 RepID=UPI002D79AD83|nr:MerR family transcriptional regulator [Novosphingobium sp. RL4]WRT91535.1 MerR family transcriptional regulator [Novosphingobium sp. RL4]
MAASEAGGETGSGFDPFGFDDGKAPDALRTIGEVTKALGIRQHVLRYWEEQFPSLQPIKRSGNRRYYRREDVVLIAAIDRLVNREGYTLRGARMALEEQPATVLATASISVGVDPSTNPKPVEAIDAFEKALQQIRERLAQALVEV